MERQKHEYLIQLPPNSGFLWAVKKFGQQIQHKAGGVFQEIVTEPIPDYDGEFRFATNGIFCGVIKAVEEAAGVDFGPLESLIDYPEPTDAVAVAHNDCWRLAELAVREWGYLGPNGADEALIINAWDSGHLDFLQRYVKVEAEGQDS